MNVHVQNAYTKRTVSRAKANTAQWHYDQALRWWGKYLSFLDHKGFYKREDTGRVRRCLSHYRYHVHVADSLLGILPYSVKRRVRPYRADTRQFADDFELALIQRGNQAKKAAGYAIQSVSTH